MYTSYTIGDENNDSDDNTLLVVDENDNDEKLNVISNDTMNNINGSIIINSKFQ